MGRPKAEIDWDFLDKIAQFPLKQEDITWLIGVSLDTLVKGVKERYGCSFSEFLNKRASKTRLMIHQKQFELAIKGNVALLIWLGKNYLGQVDNPLVIETKHMKDIEAGNKRLLLERSREAIKKLEDELERESYEIREDTTTKDISTDNAGVREHVRESGGDSIQKVPNGEGHDNGRKADT